MIRLLYIGMGGFAGAIMRFLVSGWTQKLFPAATFPYGTFAVNALGCILIGLLSGVAEARQLFTPETRALLLIGFLGSFTTFSTFGYESLMLLKGGEGLKAFFNVGAHIFIAFAGVWAGFVLAGFAQARG